MVLPGAERWAAEDAFVAGLVPTADGVIAAGGFDAMAGQPLPNVGRWDGTAWHPVGDGLPDVAYGIARADDGSVWASGLAYVARWDGAAWTIVATTDGRGPVRVATVPGGVAIYGAFTRVAELAAPGFAVWDGASWSTLGLDPGDHVDAVARDGVELCVGGVLAARGAGDERWGVACLRGGSWRPIGPRQGPISALARGPDGSWWAGGALALGIPGVARLGADGAWHEVDGGVHVDSALLEANGVAAFIFDGDDVIVGGRFSSVGAARTRAPGLARWSPTRGWQVPVPGTARSRWGAQVQALARDGDRLHVAGTFDALGAVAVSGVATLGVDGQLRPWTSTAAPRAPSGTVSTVAAAAGQTLGFGDVTAPGLSPTSAARFDGAWRPLPAGAPGQVAAAGWLSDGTLVVAGEALAAWDGVAWRVLDASTYGSPILIAADDAIYYRRAVFEVDDPASWRWRERLMRWRDGTITDLGPVDQTKGLAVVDGDLVVVQGDDWVWLDRLARDGSWSRTDDVLRAQVRDVATAPGLGVAIAIGTEVATWDGHDVRRWAASDVAALAGCRGGVVGAGADLALLDAAGWHGLAPRAWGNVMDIAIGPDGVDVGVAARIGHPALQRWLAR